MGLMQAADRPRSSRDPPHAHAVPCFPRRHRSHGAGDRGPAGASEAAARDRRGGVVSLVRSLPAHTQVRLAGPDRDRLQGSRQSVRAAPRHQQPGAGLGAHGQGGDRHPRAGADVERPGAQGRAPTCTWRPSPSSTARWSSAGRSASCCTSSASSGRARARARRIGCSRPTTMRCASIRSRTRAAS